MFVFWMFNMDHIMVEYFSFLILNFTELSSLLFYLFEAFEKLKLINHSWFTRKRVLKVWCRSVSPIVRNCSHSFYFPFHLLGSRIQFHIGFDLCCCFSVMLPLQIKKPRGHTGKTKARAENKSFLKHGFVDKWE